MGLFSKKYTIKDEIVQVLIPNLAPGAKVEKPALDRACKVFIENSKRIVTDCAKLVNNTDNAAVFFKRWEMLIDILKQSVIVEREYPKAFKPSIEKQYNKIVANEVATVNDFIDRYYSKAVAPKVIKNGTQANIVKVADAFKSALDGYKMPAASKNYYLEKYNNLVKYNQ